MTFISQSGGRHEIGIKDRDEFAFGHLQTCVQRACLVPVPVGSVYVIDRVPERRVARHNRRRHLLRLVRGVVQHLDLEPVFRILHRAHGLDEPVNDELLIEDGQLHRHARQLCEEARRVRFVIAAVLEILIAERITVHAVERQHDHHNEVRREEQGIEPVPVMVHVGKRVVEQRPELPSQAVSRGERQKSAHLLR